MPASLTVSHVLRIHKLLDGIMRRRLIIGVTVLIVALAGGVWLISISRQQDSAEQVEKLSDRLDSPDPTARLRAAEGILQHDPGHEEAAVVRIESLMAMGRHSLARDLLIDLEHELPKSLHGDVLAMYAESCLSEAEVWVVSSTVNAIGETANRFDVLVDEADLTREDLRRVGVDERVVDRLRAKSLYVRGAMLRLRLRREMEEATKINAVDLGNTSNPKNASIEDFEQRIAVLDSELVKLCGRLMATDTLDPWPRQLLFQMRIDTKDLEAARRVASGLIDLPQIEASQAGKFVNVLLDLEVVCSGYSSEQDVEISRRLLNHPSLDSPIDINHRIASARLALRDGRNEDAESVLRDVLKQHRMHPTATCLLAHSLIGQDRGGEAIRLVRPLNQRVRSARVRYALADAMLAEGETEQGRELLRQCLEIRPGYLPAAIRLTQSLVESGYITEAERDINAAIEINADHPEVLRLWMTLLVEKLDRAGMIRLIEKRFTDDPVPFGWENVALALTMVANDVPLASSLIDGRLAQNPGDTIALLGEVWLSTDLYRRFNISGVLARAILDELDADPLMKPVPTVVYSKQDSAQGIIGGPDETIPTPGRYVAWPTDVALDVVTVALERWPNEAVLIDLAARLSLWTGQTELADIISDDSANGHPPVQTKQWAGLVNALDRNEYNEAKTILMDMLANSPWPERAWLLAMQDLVIYDDNAQLAFEWLEEAEKANPRLIGLMRSRVNIHLGHAAVATHDFKRLLYDEGSDTEFRLLASDVLARERLASGSIEPAVSVFEDLALSVHDQRAALQIAALDILLENKRTRTAVISLRALLADGQIKPRWRDEALARALTVMGPTRFMGMVNGLLESSGDDPLLLYYKALALGQTGQDKEAEEIMTNLLDANPDAIRVVMELGRLAASNGRIAEAIPFFQRVVAHGGRIAASASGELKHLAMPTVPTSPTTQKAEP